MERLNARAVVEIGGISRKILKFTEVKHGDVYIRVFSGIRKGETVTGLKVREDRISLHLTPTDPVYSAIKKTLTAEDGSKNDIMQYCDAVKSKSGFAHVASIMFSNLADPVYNVTKEDMKSAFSLGGFDPLLHTFLCAIFVGAPSTEFDNSDKRFVYGRIFSEYFQIIVVGILGTFSAVTYCHTVARATMKPDGAFLGRRAVQRRRHQMQGLSAKSCLSAFLDDLVPLYRGRENFLLLHLKEIISQIEIFLVTAEGEERQGLINTLDRAKNAICGGQCEPRPRYLYVKDDLFDIKHEP